MIYHEITCTVFLNEDIHTYNAYEEITNIINLALLKNYYLKELHTEKGYKPYCFCNFTPTEKDKIYKKGKRYTFKIKSHDAKVILLIKDMLLKTSTKSISVNDITLKNYSYRFINQILTLTPAVATVNNKNWVKEDGLTLLMDRIHSNAVKKYKKFIYNIEEPRQNFIESIQQINKKGMIIKYKNTTLIGNKFLISVNSDEVSQNLAKLVVANGILEKNALGAGFCVVKS